MKPGSVIIDVAVDQGGCIETVDRATTHSSPIYVKHGVVHYAVPNMPGAVPGRRLRVDQRHPALYPRGGQPGLPGGSALKSRAGQRV